jgi:hypothetical protein
VAQSVQGDLEDALALIWLGRWEPGDRADHFDDLGQVDVGAYRAGRLGMFQKRFAGVVQLGRPSADAPETSST